MMALYMISDLHHHALRQGSSHSMHVQLRELLSDVGGLRREGVIDGWMGVRTKEERRSDGGPYCKTKREERLEEEMETTEGFTTSQRKIVKEKDRLYT
jgi:hypothetical protein